MSTASVEALSAATQPLEGDTIFGIDVRAGEVIESFFSKWGEDIPLLAIAEGFPGDGGKVYPEGASRDDALFTCIVDPIDGTRGLMYGKRSGWALAAIAPPPDEGGYSGARPPDEGEYSRAQPPDEGGYSGAQPPDEGGYSGAQPPRVGLPDLYSIEIAMQTELPTPRSHLSDVLWVVRGGEAHAETHNLLTGEATPIALPPSSARTLRHGFGTVVKFFPGGKSVAVAIEERLAEELFGGEGDGNPEIFDDEYICSGGQLYELTVGHDRFIADLRPLIQAKLGLRRLCAHPYDLCTESIARAAGVIVTDPRGEPLRGSVDIRDDCAWVGYANAELQRTIEPVLQKILREMELVPTS